MPDVSTFVVTIFYVFSKPLYFHFLLLQSLPGLNFDGLWPPIRSQSDKFWKSENYAPVQAGASKSSFGGYLFVVFFLIFMHVLSGALFF